MSTAARILFTFLLSLLSGWGLAQQVSASLKSDKNLPAINNQLISIMVEIENFSEIEREFQLEASGGKFLNLIRQSSTLTIGAGEKRFRSFKVFVTKEQPSGEAPIHFKLYDQEKNLIAESTTRLHIEAKRGLRITTLNPQEIIYQIGDSLKIKAQVHNAGNQKEKVKLAAAFPTLNGTPIIIEKTLTLDPFTSTTVSFNKVIDRDLLAQELSSVNITLLSETNEFIGNTMVLVQNALGNRRYMDPNQQRLLSEIGTGNQISWSIRNPFSKTQAAQSIDLASTFTANDLKAQLSVHATYYHDSNFPTLFQNTYLALERKGLGVKFGNLSATDLDIGLIGRGAEFYLKPFDKRKTSVRLGAVEKSYKLFDPINFKNSARGYSAYLTSEHQLNEKVAIGADIIFDQDVYTKNILASSQYEYSDQNKRYKVSLGYGITQDLENSSREENSFSAGFNYFARWKKFTFHSDNYYSSAYYPGLRKGSILFYQRIGREFKNFSTWAAYSLNHYEPKNISPDFRYSSSTKRNKGEFGIYFRSGKKLSFNFTPQIQLETASIPVTNSYTFQEVNFQLGTLSSTANYSTSNGKHRFTFSHTHGLARYKGITPVDFIYNSQLSYNFSQFILSANLQKGNLLLYEGVRGGEISNDTKKYTALVNYYQDFFNNRLRLNLTGMVSKDSYLGTNASISTNAELKIGRSLKAFGYYNFTKYFSSQYNYENSYVQFGLTYALPQFGDPITNYKTGNIEIFVFQDLNNNGLYDQGIDKPASGHEVSINKTLFISNKDGEVTYRRLPYGTYQVKSLAKEWFFDAISIKLDRGKVTLMMPLEKTGTIKGQLKYDQYNRNQYEISGSLSGIALKLTDHNERTFTTYTAQDGTFQAFVPLGDYKISIDPNTLQRKVYVDGNEMKASAKENETTVLPVKILKIQERKVEIQRFGQ